MSYFKASPTLEGDLLAVWMLFLGVVFCYQLDLCGGAFVEVHAYTDVGICINMSSLWFYTPHMEFSQCVVDLLQ